MVEEKCIYCTAAFDPRQGQGDHIIPAQLGEFKDDVRFRRICPSCNGKIGHSEQQLLQSGPTALGRALVRPPGRRKRESIKIKNAAGAPYPVFLADMAGYHALVDLSPDNPREALPVDQIVIQDPHGNIERVRLYPGMRLEQLQKKIKTQNIHMVRLDAREQHCNEYIGLLKGLSPGIRMEEKQATERGTYQRQGRIGLFVTDRYFRAIAKMAFHYYLAHNCRQLRGDEPEFGPIRDFIMQGGDISQFFHSSGRTFLHPFRNLPTGEAIVPNRWCHILVASETAGVAVIYVNLFLGPGAVPLPYHVTLHQVPSRSIASAAHWGHLYIYYHPQPETGHAGYVEPLSLIRMR